MLLSAPTQRPSTVADPARLAELDAFAILDTPPEEGFEDTVQLAALICAVPVALVSFVAADRQWFKARVGFPACETDLNASVCAYALAEPDLLVIPDLTMDPRTRNNPLVTGHPNIRFYAGAPLRTPTGQVLGSLCVIDTQPRPAGLTERESDALRRLSRQTMVLLQERRQVELLRIAAERAESSLALESALIELGDHLSDLPDIAAMTSVAAGIVGRTLGASRAGYGDLDDLGQVVEIIEDWTQPGTETLAGLHRLVDFGELGAIIRNGDILAVPDVEREPRLAPDALIDLGIRALLNVPLRERGRVVGLFYAHSTTARHWTREEVGFVRNVGDRVLVAIGRRRSEEQQALLNNELAHRMKNMVAIVQAIATQTIRNATDLPAAQEALSARLVAMGKAHDLLIGGSRESASLDAVIREALAIHDDAQVGRLRLNGPHVHIGSRAAMSLALVVHELATNAAKYGALSMPDGHVDVVWNVEPGDAGANLRLEWSEHGGPPVEAPSRRGFGSRLIERALTGAIGGRVLLDYRREGLVCELNAKLAEIESDH